MAEPPTAQKQSPIDLESPEVPAEPIHLATLNSARIYVWLTNEPWEQPAQAMVIPIGRQIGLQGGFSRTYLRRVNDSDGKIRDMIQRTVKSETKSDFADPAQPVFIQLDPSVKIPPAPESTQALKGEPPLRWLVAATSHGESGHNIENTRTAVLGILPEAVRHDITHMTVPLLGSGSGGLPSDEVVVTMLDATRQYLVDSDYQGGILQEITFTTRDPKAVQAAEDWVTNLTNLIGQRLLPDSEEGVDHLNVAREIKALARMLVMRELKPPLAVGILGGWGTGKSFVMNIMHEEITRIRGKALKSKEAWPQPGQQNEDVSVYVGHVYQVKFNAWTYAKSDLWASLMQTIFQELSRQLTLEQMLVDAGVDPLEGGKVWRTLNKMREDERQLLLEEMVGKPLDWWKEDDQLWKILRDLQGKIHEQLNEKEKELRGNQEKLAAEEAKLYGYEPLIEAQKLQQQTWIAMEETLKEDLGTSIGPFKTRLMNQINLDEQEILMTWKQVAPPMRKLFQLARQDRGRFIAFWILGLVELLSLSSPIWIELLNWPDLIMLPASVVAVLNGVFSAQGILQPWLNRWSDRLMKNYRLFENELETQRKNERSQVESNVNTLQGEIKTLEREVEGIQQRLGLPARYKSTRDFINQRLQDETYKERLGLMEQVQNDLFELSESLGVTGSNEAGEVKTTLSPREKRFRNHFPRGPVRVVLYIDDLDRCPPDKVIDILEACQLLLKSKLFIVVMALDVRYITRALEKAYEDILVRRGDPSGLDYIEKIIQIPYRVRPLQREAVPTYLLSQMDVEIQTTEDHVSSIDNGGSGDQDIQALLDTISAVSRSFEEEDHEETVITSEVVRFSLEEYRSIEDCCKQIPLTPRSAKRLINVFKLLKIYWATERQVLDEPVERLVATLLALSGRFPDLMRDIFDVLEGYLRQMPVPFITFNEFLEKYGQEYIQPRLDPWDERLDREWAELKEAAAILLKQKAPHLEAIELPLFNLVRSFCFVGDIGYEPDEEPTL